ncbi:mitochondrial 54S ribosomal protein mL57 ASCRUDRAFT_31525 [Ascoidea rubescens DSM 1968]|uniref:RNase III domain-containing protein n=1 Tax=Ascoidea rubescens DSM 1968 TaxID=1344418 RepID=A0A1D2VNJ6_9ASCO|nr:hypothetical protein ASCRUDRAFT_31525 [Ascoidea rubescens DSM 1968]ODV63147.1 hypothetical protein ASCRUDRAFT_31525 [Ascoidea rubescens DSM 1968]
MYCIKALASPSYFLWRSTFARNIVLHSGKRQPGALRDPNDYLISPSGIKYSPIKEVSKVPEASEASESHEYSGSPEEIQESLKPIKSYFHSIDPDLIDKNQISDKLLLQILTHKSFSHGHFPYSEKLSVIGFKFLKKTYFINTIHQSLQKPIDQEYFTNSKFKSFHNYKNYNFLINEFNFADLFRKDKINFLSVSNLAKISRSKQFSKILFWKPTSKRAINKDNDTIYAEVLKALIGALLLSKGAVYTQYFIEKNLINPLGKKN